ncbi:MAG: thiamine diphosphokinase [candidate division Zixibacteria bacterium]|nr:thiamine diphosphokinase [candidate division Zixibacteria bacterium]
MPAFVLYLHGPYRKSDLPFYKHLARGKTRMAVDGGLSFFIRSGLRPDVIMGDFDSLKRDPAKLFPKTRVLRFPSDKDKTDTQLAVEYAVAGGATSIDIVEPFLGEADHFTGNLMLLAALVSRPSKRSIRFRVMNPAYEIIFLNSGTREIVGEKGDTISVVPLTETIRLTCSGTRYKARGLKVRRGETVGLRNQMTAARATVSVKGQAFVFHQFRR